MIRKIFRILWRAIILFVGLSIFWVVLFRFLPVFYTPLMTIRALENVSHGKQMICTHDWEPLENISPNLQKAVIASEDSQFFKHHGFDFKAIQKAIRHNEKKGKRIHGGSTISQQTAKNVFLWQGRSWIRKGLEAYFTVLIETLWGKQRIMEVYLNSIEMGDGIYGIEAASQFWYHKTAQHLTKREAAGIAAILPNPRKFNPVKSSAYIERKKGRIVARMAAVKELDY